MIKKYQCKAITFFDNDFLADRESAAKILETLIAGKLNREMKFCIQSRVTHMDHETARLLRKAGCVKVEFGLETGDAELLDRMNKNTTIDKAEQAVQICREYGISVQANLLMGFEGEKLETLERTLNWVKKLKVDNFNLSMVQLYPGSKLYQEHGQCFIEDSEWSRHNLDLFFKTDHLSSIALQIEKPGSKKEYGHINGFYTTKVS